MSQLLRIILIHTHLPGVVELNLNGHSNICGTNASGKTTLQRLIPVFYGEQPSRVVPKTRDRFDVFYLPYQNSYLVYEYESGGHKKQVVLTKRADGVDYRFVDAPYQNEQYLEDQLEGIQALNYQAWGHQLRDLNISSSHKISATSEYRAIIQNDLSVLRSQYKDSLKLRQLAARFALASGDTRLRHIEKLVSAVHAKEGKMDTLKSMLATILEEDGYQRPENTFKPNKIRAWIKEMRQFMRMDVLQAQYEKIKQRLADTASTQKVLWQLKPILDADRFQLRKQIAEDEQALNDIKRAQNEAESAYKIKRRELEDNLSRTSSEHQQIERNLEQAEFKRTQFLDQGIESLAQDIKTLPSWQQSLEEKSRHLQLMLEKNGDIEKQIEQRKNQLSESLDRLVRKNQRESETLRSQQASLRDQQSDTLADVQRTLLSQQQEIQQELSEQIQRLQSEKAGLQAQLDMAPLSHADHEAMQLADARIEEAQVQAEHTQILMHKAEQAVRTQQQSREKADQELIQARQACHTLKADLAQAERNFNPEAGTLRHYLYENVPGWEESVGKVIAEPLLQRTDLAPQIYDSQSSSLFGLTLDLSAIESPDYVQSEEALKQAVKHAKSQLNEAEQARDMAAGALENYVQQVKEAEQTYQQVRQQYRSFQQDLEYAREAKKRLQNEHKNLIKDRQQQHRLRVEQIGSEQEALEKDGQRRLQTLQHDSKALELEHKADFQEQLDELDEALAFLNQQIEGKRTENKAQIQELEQRINKQLADEGVDAKRLQTLKGDMESLRERIGNVKERQHELTAYDDFIQSTWVQQRPQWLNEEQSLKQQLENLNSSLQKLKHDTEVFTKGLEVEEHQLKDRLFKQQKYIKEVESQLARFNELTGHEAFNEAEGKASAYGDFGDIHERLQRMQEALNGYHENSKGLRDNCDKFSALLRHDASTEFEQLIEREFVTLGENPSSVQQAKLLGGLLNILQDQQRQIIDQGINIGGGLQSFFKVFDDINRRIGQYSQRLTAVVGDELDLDGIDRSEVKISSTIDELGFWQPLKELSYLYQQWTASGELLPPEAYLNRLADVADLLRADQVYSLESLLRLELYLNERGSELIIRNDRQLLESSSHGMAYLILCKFLLAFTRLLRGNAEVTLHWPIDEIGTLAYHNVEKLFTACSNNQIHVVGAFPNPESDVLLLFTHRYLIEAHAELPGKGQLKRIQPRISKLSAKLAEKIDATQTNREETNA